MHPQRFLWIFAFSVCAVILGACDSTVLPSSSAPNAQFVFFIPSASPSPSSAPQLVPASLKKPLYISAATASISVQPTAVNGVKLTSPPGPTIVNVAGTTNCEADTTRSGVNCIVGVALPVGIDTLTISTYDQSNANGNILSQQIYAADISLPPAGAFTFVLDANPATATISVTAAGTATGSQSAGFTAMTSGTQAFSITLKDAQGYTLMGAGLPALSAASSNSNVATVALNGNTLTITPVALGTGTITVTASPADSQTTSDGLSNGTASFSLTVVAPASPTPAPSTHASPTPTPSAQASPTPTPTPASTATPALIAAALSQSVGSTGSDQVRIYQYTPGSSSISSYGSIPNSVFGSSAILNLVQFDSSGDLYVGNTPGNTVSIFSAAQLNQTVSSATHTLDTNAGIQQPQAFAVASDQLLAVGNSGATMTTLTEHTTAGQSSDAAAYSFATGGNVAEALAFIPGASTFSTDSLAFVGSSTYTSALYLCNGLASNLTCSQSAVGGVNSPNNAITYLAWSATPGKLYLANSAYAGNGPGYVTGVNNLVYYTSLSGTIPTLHTLASSLSGFPTALAVSPDGHVAVAACANFLTPAACTVSMWDTSDTLVSTWNGVSIPGVNGLAFLSNNNLAVSGASLQVYTIGGTLTASTTFPSGYSSQAMAAH